MRTRPNQHHKFSLLRSPIRSPIALSLFSTDYIEEGVWWPVPKAHKNEDKGARDAPVKENQKMPQKIFTRCKDEGEKKKRRPIHHAPLGRERKKKKKKWNKNIQKLRKASHSRSREYIHTRSTRVRVDTYL